MPLPSRVFIREVGPREGLQILADPHLLSTAQKIELVHRLAAAGASEIEVTSMVRPDRVPAMADADEVVRGIKRPPIVEGERVRFTALYLNHKGFERAEKLGNLDNQGWLYSATSDTFLSKNANTTRAKIIDEVPRWLELFAEAGKTLHGVMISTAFGCGYEGFEAAERLGETLNNLLEALKKFNAAPVEVSFADTVGLAEPEGVRRAARWFRQKYPSLRLSLHLHDTRGLGLANAYAGLLEGVDCFDASIGGIGGCPFTPGAAGNIATEDLVYLCDRLGISTGISHAEYCAAARWLNTILVGSEPARGKPLPGKSFCAP